MLPGMNLETASNQDSDKADSCEPLANTFSQNAQDPSPAQAKRSGLLGQLKLLQPLTKDFAEIGDAAPDSVDT
jgi:hypothetical protein